MCLWVIIRSKCANIRRREATANRSSFFSRPEKHGRSSLFARLCKFTVKCQWLFQLIPETASLGLFGIKMYTRHQLYLVRSLPCFSVQIKHKIGEKKAWTLLSNNMNTTIRKLIESLNHLSGHTFRFRWTVQFSWLSQIRLWAVKAGLT